MTTITRGVAVHFWPANPIAAPRHTAALAPTSASGSAIAAFWPPISHCAGTPRRAAASRTADPGGHRPGEGDHVGLLDDGLAGLGAPRKRYSDSATDVPMLEAVGHPFAVNADRALRKIAAERDWPTLTFSNAVPLRERISGLRPEHPTLTATAVGAGIAAGSLVWFATRRRARRA